MNENVVSINKSIRGSLHTSEVSKNGTQSESELRQQNVQGQSQ